MSAELSDFAVDVMSWTSEERFLTGGVKDIGPGESS